MLFDSNFPLINTEMSRAEFDTKVRENPMNDHLRVAIQPEKETDSTERDYSKYTPVMQEYFKLRTKIPIRLFCSKSALSMKLWAMIAILFLRHSVCISLPV